MPDYSVYLCKICAGENYSRLYSLPRYPYKAEQLKDQSRFGYVKCSGCGLISQYPVISADSLAGYYDQDDYIGNESKLLEWLILLHYRIGRHLAKGKGRRLLDIGAGDGKFLQYACQRGWEVYGADVSERAREIAAKKRRIRVTPIQDIAGFPDEYFDRITLYHVIEHLQDLSGIFQLVRKKLKRLGVCVIEVPVADSWEYGIFQGGTFWVNAPYHISIFTCRDLRRLASRQGFKVSSVYQDWHTPLMFIFSIFYFLERKSGYFIPHQFKKMASLLFLPFLFPVFIAAALSGKSSVRTFHLKKEG